MTDTPNGELAQPPQFSADYWSRAPRKLMPPLAIVELTTKDGHKLVRLADGAVVSHPIGDISQLLTVGTLVQAQIIPTGQGRIVTGLFVPQTNGWAWQLTAEDLAQTTREMHEALQQQQREVKLQMVLHLKSVMMNTLQQFNWTTLSQQITDEALDQLAEELATEALIALEMGPQ